MRTLTTVMLLLLLLSANACRSTSDGEQAEDAKAEGAQQEQSEVTSIAEEEKGDPVTLAAPVPLIYRFAKGEKFGYLIKTVEEVNFIQDTLEDNNRQLVNFWYRFEVLEAFEPGGGRMRVTCDRATFSGNYSGKGGDHSFAYDSDADNTYDIEKLYAKYNAPVDTPFEIVLEADGRISDVSKLREVIKNYLKDDFATTKSDQIELITRDYAEAGLKSILQLVFQKLSDKPVGKDSTWVIVRPEKIGYLEVRNDAVYTVKDVVESPSGRLAHIDAKLTSRYTGNPKMDTGQGIATMDSFDVKGRGLTVFNLGTGKVKRRSLRTDVKVRMYVEPPEELKQVAPEVRNFWWVQNASIENTIESYNP